MSQRDKIRMSDEEVTLAGIKAALASDPAITEPQERCQLYLSSFGRDLDRAEYDSFGPEGCAQFDPETLRRF